MMKIPLCAFFLANQGLLALALANNHCRCLSTDPCWPSPREFASLQAQLSQPLLNPIRPTASPCYPASSLSGNCSQVHARYTDGVWRASVPGSMQSPNWETYEHGDTIEACCLNVTVGARKCEQGSVPTVGVDARVPGDVVAAVNFARKRGLRVVVKSTGHDFLARSTARGSFLIWLHNMKNISYNESFVPKGSPATETYQAVTIGPGAQWREAYEFIHMYNRTLVGGSCDTVGAAGGWVLGGGHSTLSHAYGLGVDQVLQLTVVTSTGAYLTASAHSHPSLFWALRGGGGGTYGVVTSVTYKTHPETSLTMSLLVASIGPGSKAGYKKLLTEFFRISPVMSDAGWVPIGIWNSTSFVINGLGLNISKESANVTWGPFHAFAQGLAGEGVQVQVTTTTPFNSWFELYKNGLGTTPVGQSVELWSRLFARDFVEGEYERLAETFVENDISIIWLPTVGAATLKIDPESTGLTPAWRSALALAVHFESWAEGTPLSEIEKTRDRTRKSLKVMEELVPGAGSYLNEASLYEENPRHTFFGSHYDRLKAIKDKYDAEEMFVVAGGVGSDEWDKSLNCRH